jgi:predicted ATPase
MIGSRLKILIFIAYRDQEATEVLDRLVSNEYATVHALSIDALDFDSLVDYISDALHRPLEVDRDSILPLADMVYRKTRGNAFYTSQLLATLEKKKFIFFNWEENEWDYNLTDIQQAIMTNEGADKDAELDISFLVNRLKELPLDGQRLLKWASFVGDTFSWNTVKYLMVHSDPESELSDTNSDYSSARTADDDQSSVSTARLTATTPHDESNSLVKFQSKANSIGSTSKSSSRRSRDPINGLQAALQEGYILPLESDEFKWSHDRYSQAAMELADPRTREKIHLKIAKYLLNSKGLQVPLNSIVCTSYLFYLIYFRRRSGG